MTTIVSPPKHEIPILNKNEDGSVTGLGFYEVTFPSSVLDSMEIKGHGDTFQWRPTELVYKDEHGQFDYIVGSSPSSLSMMKKQVRYVRTFPNADDFFNVEGNKVKHWTILNEPPREPAEYLNGSIYFGVSGTVNGIDLPLGIHEQMEVNLMEFPKPIVKDMDGNEVEGFYEVIDSNDGQQLFIWFDATFLEKAIYPVMIDPTVIIGNSTRMGNITELSNGWIVVGVMTGDDYFGTQSAIFYVSKDKGETFSRLTEWKGRSVTAPSMVSIGTTVYAVSTRSYTPGIEFTQFDALAVGSSISSIHTAPGTDRSYSNPDIHIDDQGNLHVVWADRNMYGNWTLQSNVKYIKGIRNLSDGTVAWGTVESVTNFTRSTEEGTSPRVVANRYGNPIISYRYYYHPGDNEVSPSNPILNQTRVAHKQLNGQWKENTFSSNVGSATFAFRVQNRIFITWNDKTNNRTDLKLSISDDDGESFTHKTIVEGVSASAKMVYDRTGRLYVFYSSQFITSDNLGTSFSSPMTLGVSPSVVHTRDDSDVIGYMYFNNSSIVFDKILLNYPPNPPSNLSPANGDSRDRALEQRLSWQYVDQDVGDSQARFELQWRLQGVSTWNNVSQSTSNTYWIVEPNTFPHGVIEWRVRTYDQRGEVSPYSSIEVFIAGDKPDNPIVLSPSESEVIPRPECTVSWSSIGQVKYRLRLLHENEEVYSFNGGSETQHIIGYNLDNLTEYKIELTIANSDGVWSDNISVTISVEYTQPPVPQLILSSDMMKASVFIDIHRPEPIGDQPPIQSVEVFRRKSGERIWTRIANTTEDYIIDYECPFGLYEYTTSSIGTTGAISSKSVPQSVDMKFDGWWIIDQEDEETFQFLYNIPALSVESEEDRYEIKTFSPKPFVRYGSVKVDRGSLSGWMIPGGHESPRETAMRLLRLIDKRKPVILKNHYGDSWRVNIHTPSRSLNPINYEDVNVEWVEI